MNNNFYSKMLFIIISILGSCLIKHIWKSSYPFPYTSALLFLGGLLAILSEHISETDNVYHNSINFWFTIDPHSLLLILIPPLIYNAAMHINFHILRKSLPSILILILPGVLISTFFTGLFIQIIDNNFNWNTGLLLGSILSATDPVAVINILEKMKITKKLSVLIDGESLLNDGTAYVLFILLLKVIDGDDVVDIVITTLRLSFGGLFFGLLMGIVLFLILKSIYNDIAVEISLTIIFCYFTFYLAEKFLEVSSILSVALLGFVMSYLGKICITPVVKKSMEHVWTIIDFLANNIIFILTGLIIIKNLYNNPIYEWSNLFILYLVVNGARMFIILIFYPCLKNKKYNIGSSQLLIVSLSGLRGAITLVLSLITTNKTNVPGERILFYCAGIVFLSIVFNSILIKIILKYCSNMFDDNSELISKILNVRGYLYNLGLQNIDNIKNLSSYYLRNVEWDAIKSQIINKREQSVGDVILTIENEQLQSRIIFLKTLKKTCWFLYDKKKIIYRDTILTLIELIDNCLDTNACHWVNMIDHYCQDVFISPCLKTNIFTTLRRKYLYHSINHRYNIASGFIVAQQYTLKRLATIITKKHIMDELQNESLRSINCAVTFIRMIERKYPLTTKKIETKQSIYNVLQTQRKELTKLYKNGEINDEIFEHLSREIDKKLYHMEIII